VSGSQASDSPSQPSAPRPRLCKFTSRAIVGLGTFTSMLAIFEAEIAMLSLPCPSQSPPCDVRPLGLYDPPEGEGMSHNANPGVGFRKAELEDVAVS
jgi:hypothetical protein